VVSQSWNPAASATQLCQLAIVQLPLATVQIAPKIEVSRNV